MIESMIALGILWFLYETGLLQPVVVIALAAGTVVWLGWWTILVIIIALVIGGLWEYQASKIDKDLRGY